MSTKGLWLVAGDQGVGKSTRLLSIIHSGELNNTIVNRDVIWIDFDQVFTESDGMARISSQLGLLKCQNIPDMLSKLRHYISTYRSSTTIILDNLHLRPHVNRRATCFSGNDISAQEIDYTRWKSFVQELIATVKHVVDSHDCSLVVTCRQFYDFKDMFDWDRMYIIQPLPDEVANTMIERMRPKYNQVCHHVNTANLMLIEASIEICLIVYNCFFLDLSDNDG